VAKKGVLAEHRVSMHQLRGGNVECPFTVSLVNRACVHRSHHRQVLPQDSPVCGVSIALDVKLKLSFTFWLSSWEAVCAGRHLLIRALALISCYHGVGRECIDEKREEICLAAEHCSLLWLWCLMAHQIIEAQRPHVSANMLSRHQHRLHHLLLSHVGL
jgi:hypothetical protein